MKRFKRGVFCALLCQLLCMPLSVSLPLSLSLSRSASASASAGSVRSSCFASGGCRREVRGGIFLCYKNDNAGERGPGKVGEQSNYGGGYNSVPLKVRLGVIKERISVSSMVSKYCPSFKQSYSQGKGSCVCPFHGDSDPSLVVNDEKGIWKCFGCGVGGDVVEFYKCIRRLEEGGTGSGSAAGDGKNRKGEIYEIAEEMERMAGITGPNESKTANANNSYNSYNRNSASQSKALQAQEGLKLHLYRALELAQTFYALNLIKDNVEGAGKARMYLKGRGIGAATCRAYGVGYAAKGTGWGENSLVANAKSWDDFNDGEGGEGAYEYLKLTGDVIESTSVYVSTSGEEGKKLYRDRMTDRIMVPIRDHVTGKVVGFGGRSIKSIGGEEDGDDDDDNTAAKTKKKKKKNTTTTATTTTQKNKKKKWVEAKYINSPESVVFKKGNVVFGLDVALKMLGSESSSGETATKAGASPDSDSESASESGSTLFVTEGYMDVMSLHTISAPSCASMGTGITMTQLEAACDATKGLASDVTFMFDNDEAGRGAVRRFCERYYREIADLGRDLNVCWFPDGYKDAGEYVERLSARYRRRDDPLRAVRSDFLEHVEKHSVPWDEYMIQDIFLEYSKGDGDVEGMLDKVTNIVISIPEGIKRTAAIGKLTDMLYKAIRTKGGDDEGLRMRIGEDVLAEVKRKERDGIRGRVRSSDARPDEQGGVMERIMGGEGSGNPLSSDAFVSNDGKVDREQQLKKLGSIRRYGKGSSNGSSSNDNSEYQVGRRQAYKFSGVEFANPTDKEWIGWGRADQSLLGSEYISDKSFKPYYFGSNPNNDIAPAPSTEDEGVALLNSVSLTWPSDEMANVAEVRLLRSLISHARSRSSMKSAMRVFQEFFSPSKPTDSSKQQRRFVEWSSADREWLFNNLIGCGGCEGLPEELDSVGMTSQIKEYLVQQRGGKEYPEWFSEATNGTLDLLFSSEGRDPIEGLVDLPPKIQGRLAELQVQETLALLLLGGAIRHRSKVLHMWRDATVDVVSYEDDGDNDDGEGSLEKLKELAQDAATDLKIATDKVRELEESYQRISKKVLQFSISDYDEALDDDEDENNNFDPPDVEPAVDNFEEYPTEEGLPEPDYDFDLPPIDEQPPAEGEFM